MASVTARLLDGVVTEITNGRHTWQADEPPSAGGTDTGPNPYDLLLGSLAACTCITLALYCRHKGWTLTSVEAAFEHDRIHADDCRDCDEHTTGYVDLIRSRIEIEGDFDDVQRRRIEQVAVRCPVHRTLAAPTHFEESVTVRSSGS